MREIKISKKAVIIGVAVIAIICLLTFGLSLLMNKIYYNPSEITGKSEMTAITLPLMAFTELHCTDVQYSNSVIKKGFGKYIINLNPVGPSWKKNSNTILNRGKFGNDETFFKAFQDAYTESFEFNKYENYISDKNEKEKKKKRDDSEYINELKKLPESAVVRASIVLKNDITLKQLSKLIEKYNIYINYAAVNWGQGKNYGYKLGFCPVTYGVNIGDDYNKEKYPSFSLSEHSTSDEWEAHFKSLLKLMLDQKEFRHAVPQGFFANPYEEALDYVEKKGVEVFALVLCENPKKLLKLKKDPLVDLITIKDVKVSSYSQ